jgi:hypothetical protein
MSVLRIVWLIGAAGFQCCQNQPGNGQPELRDVPGTGAFGDGDLRAARHCARLAALRKVRMSSIAVSCSLEGAPPSSAASGLVTGVSAAVTPLSRTPPDATPSAAIDRTKSRRSTGLTLQG